MDPETIFGIACVITVGFSTGVMLLLWRYLDPVLADYCGNARRGRLWSVLCAIIFLSPPLFALTIDLRPNEAAQSWVFAVVAHLRLPLIAIVFATLIVIGIALALHIPRDLPMSRTELDDLKRLMDKIQEVRARELLNRISSASHVSAKELDELKRLVDKVQELRTRDFLGRGGNPHSTN